MTTLQEAQNVVRQGVGKKGGCTCPCCGKHCEEYRFSVTSPLAQGLHRLYAAGRPLHLKEFCQGRGGGYNSFNSCVLKNFGLIQQVEGDESKPFNRSGIWMITSRGRQWIEGLITIPKYAFVFDNKVSGFSTEEWSWQAALRGKWSPEDTRHTTPGLSDEASRDHGSCPHPGQ